MRDRLRTRKFVDDTTYCVRDSGSRFHLDSDMQPTIETLIVWSQLNHMNISCKKTKEMIIGPLSMETVTSLSIGSTSAERVTVERFSLYELLGVMISSTLTRWPRST